MDINQYRIGELAEKAGVTRRTIHYYLSRGLIPPSEGAGLGTTYSDEHLYRIVLIRKMQDTFLPLDEIKKRITHLTLEEVKNEIKQELSSFKLEETTEIYASAKSLGITYSRVNLAFGVELHIPVGNRKAEELVDSILNFVEKTRKEG